MLLRERYGFFRDHKYTLVQYRGLLPHAWDAALSFLAESQPTYKVLEKDIYSAIEAFTTMKNIEKHLLNYVQSVKPFIQAKNFQEVETTPLYELNLQAQRAETQAKELFKKSIPELWLGLKYFVGKASKIFLSSFTQKAKTSPIKVLA